MKKPCIEFINACAWCDMYRPLVEGISSQYHGVVDTKIYVVGKDFDYIRKYGPIMKSVVIINEKKKIDNLSKKSIEDAFEEAIRMGS